MSSCFLVINVSRIGDTLLATPAIRAIATARPGCVIDVLSHPNRASILRHLPFVRHLGEIDKTSAPFRGWLGGKVYDVAFVYGFDEPLVAYALRVARQVVAFRQANGKLNARLHRIVEPPAFQSEHSVLQLLRLPAALDIPAAGLRLAYTVTPAETAWARQTLASTSPPTRTPLIGLQVASFPTKAYRDWPVESFMALCDRIRLRWPEAHFLIFGGSEERRRTEALKSHLDAAATLHAGRLSLRETVALMNETDLYVGVDTGPTHLMSTLDIPLVGLYHGFSPSRLIGPLEHPCAYLIDHPLADQNCSTEASMADIAVDRVWRTVERALAEHPPRLR
ncbi:MAG: glycosyltransferase family 9 protein [Candidatus Accumulibacter sp.]|nr:glycosyltransferase family 9 protein [Accumulibacter sp.]